MIRKGVGNHSGFQDQSKVDKMKKARYTIGNVSEKDLSKIIKEFEKIGKLTYEERVPKHEPTPSYFNLVRQLAKCMMISDELNWHVHGSYAKKLLYHRTLMLRTRKNQKKSSCMKLYQRINIRT